jgi:hypothetical protein
MTPVDAGGCRSAALTWLAPDDEGERRRLDAWCAAVGPAVVLPPAPVESQPVRLEDITFVSWNVHEGNGDLVRLMNDLSAGRHVARKTAHYVLMLQEALRTDGVPPLAAGMAGAGRIEAKDGAPTDIVQIARGLGLSLVYVPSMRNGHSPDDPREDRGCAILSTLPLTDPVAVELPGDFQRRVAIVAGVGPVRAGAIHLNATGSWSVRLRLFWTPWLRDVQIRSMRTFLPDGPLVVGADLNSWHGRDEPGVRVLDRMARETPVTIDRRGLGLRVLDYLFFRVGANRRAHVREIDDRYGSDHRPLVGWVD